MNFDIEFAFIILKGAVKAIPTTIILAIVPFIFGLIIGTFLAIARIYKIRFLDKLAQIYVVVIKGIPIVLILLMTYFIINVGFDKIAESLSLNIRFKDVNPIVIVFVALCISAIANISEVMRGSILSVGVGQIEAAYSVGLTPIQTIIRIVFPQAFITAIPLLCSAFTGLVKGASLAFMVAVIDLLNAALVIANDNYKYLEAYVVAAILYWIINASVEKLFYLLEKKYEHLRGGIA